MLNNTQLTMVDNFVYLGSSVAADGSVDTEINARVKAACAVFSRLRQRLWSQRNIRRSTKCKVYRAVVLANLLYAVYSVSASSQKAESGTTSTPPLHPGNPLAGQDLEYDQGASAQMDWPCD